MTSAVALATRALPSPKQLQVMKDSLLRQLRRKGTQGAAYRCRHCGSRIEVHLILDDNLKEIGSTGECRTPGCITWKE